MKNLKVRETLCFALLDNASKIDCVREEVMQSILNLNKIKRGLADVEIDYDLAIKTIEQIERTGLYKLSAFELKTFTYSILFHLQSPEFSLRDYCSHFMKQIF